jgi:murein DD-endopeptidase MepM/ murein hydrolase activator NlpD
MMQDILNAFKLCFKQWFPQRNLIVVSEHKVKHIPISGAVQCAMLMVLGSLVCWGAYSTGSYMAVRMAFKNQTQTLKSIADQRVATNFSTNTLYPTAPLAPNADISEDAVQSLSSPMFTLSALDNDKLVGRVTFLEKRVNELQTANNNIIQRVREKTSGRMAELEGIIRQVGMNPALLKKAVSEQKPEPKKSKSQGGPYIPADTMSMSAAETEMNNNLDEYAVLQQVVDTLPLSYPIKNSEEQSKFGNRIDPFTGRLAFHSGLDLSGPAGSRVYATAPGKVSVASRSGAYGNMVDISHGFDISTRYGHLSQILVSVGQIVKKGDLIGIQGSTGRSTGQHLHYEVRYHDRPLNPKSFLKVAQNVSQE